MALRFFGTRAGTLLLVVLLGHTAVRILNVFIRESCRRKPERNMFLLGGRSVCLKSHTFRLPHALSFIRGPGLDITCFTRWFGRQGAGLFRGGGRSFFFFNFSLFRVVSSESLGISGIGMSQDLLFFIIEKPKKQAKQFQSARCHLFRALLQVTSGREFRPFTPNGRSSRQTGHAKMRVLYPTTERRKSYGQV